MAKAAAVSTVTRTPLQYLDRALKSLRDLGLVKGNEAEGAPVVGLLEKITDLAPDKVAVIARTLSQMSLFNEVVREQISEMSIVERYEKIAAARSIRSATMPRPWSTRSPTERSTRSSGLTNAWMKISRGDIATRFDQIRDTYLDVAKDTKANIEREHTILEAYLDFRGALKQAEVSALEVLKVAEGSAGKGQGRSRKRGRRQSQQQSSDDAGGPRPPRTCPRREAPRHAGGGQPLPGRQGPRRQPDHRLQHLGSDHGAADADHERQGARLSAGGVVLQHQRIRC